MVSGRKSKKPTVPLPPGLVTVVNQAKTPKPKAKKVRVPNKPKTKKVKARKMVCPSRAATLAVDFPVHLRTVEYTIAANTTSIFAFAPFGDVVGARYATAISPPDGATAVTVTTIIDAYLTSMFSPPTVDGATNTCSGRWTDFCVEAIMTTPLANVAGSTVVMRWQQSGIPLIGAGTPLQLLSAYNTMGEDPLAEETSNAQFTKGLCTHAAMTKRLSLDFMNINTGSSAWANVYGSTAVADNAGESYNAPYTPILYAITVPTGGTAQTLRFIVKGNLQVAPPRSWFLARMAHELPIGGASAEDQWMRHQHALLRSPLLTAPMSASRDPGPYVGA
jgi:hypothetical protein